MSIDAMKQALEALEMLAKWEHPASNITTKSGRIYPHHVAKNSAATLRLAIEQAERQEPVAWVCEGSSSDEKHAIDYQQEDVDAIPIGTMLYTAPPQRQPLTDEEIKAVIRAGEYDSMEEFARAIERKHGIGGGE